MRVLTICRKIPAHKEIFGYAFAPYIKEQNEALEKLGVSFDYFLIKNHGLLGYLKHFLELLKTLKKNNYDLVHAHGGHIGIITIMQRTKPVIITFHGSDININILKQISKIACRFSAYNIFVSEDLKIKANIKKTFSVIPCGVNLDLFYPLVKTESRKRLGWSKSERIILFSGYKNNRIKNYYLAKSAIKKILNTRLVELKGFNKDELLQIFNGADMLLMTSFSEGSPQIIKEAMACNCPIVSTDVGDVKLVVGDTKGCYITSFEPNDIAEKIVKVLEFREKTNGRERIKKLGLDSNNIANRLIDVYKKVLVF